MRAEAEKKQIPFRYSGKWRTMPPDAPGPPGVDPVIRIKTPEEGSTSWKERWRSFRMATEAC